MASTRIFVEAIFYAAHTREESIVLKSIIGVAVGGALGASLRYGIALWHPSTGFPWATLIANGLGSLLFGLVLAIGQRHTVVGQDLAPLLLTGFLGGLTTFSSLVNDTNNLMGTHGWLHAAGNIALHLALGLGCLWLGRVAGDGLMRLVSPPS